MKTAISISVMTVLSGAGAAAWAQAPTTQSEPTQQTAPRAHSTQPTQSGATKARENSSGHAASREDEAKLSASQHLELQAMDVDKNGLVSRQEYMSHYEDLYAKMEKDSAGMISLKDLTASTSGSEQTR